MFKRKFKNQFDFSEDLFFSKKEKEIKEFDRIVYVIYDKLEVLDFLKTKKAGTNVLVCLFNKQFYRGLSFLEEMNSLILLDESKTRNEIVEELVSYFKIKRDTNSDNEKVIAKKSKAEKLKFYEYYKAMYYLM